MSDPFLGEVCIFAGNFAPTGWATCDGQLLAISSNQSLFAILGTTYGGDARTTFALPGLRGRVPIGAGTGVGLTTRNLGTKLGQSTVSLTSSQIPAHTHTENGTLSVVLRGRAAEDGTQSVPDPSRILGTLSGAQDINIYSSSDASLTPIGGVTALTATVANTGSSSGHENHQPYIGLTYIIALVGVFPSQP